jgi:hypothetical protein
MSIGITANVNAYATAERTMTMMTTRRHNTEIRQAGPETHEPNPQRNPALPASNG